MAFSRLCGVTQYSYYMVDIMEETNTSNTISAKWASAAVTIFEIVGSILAMILCDKLGRRKLLMSSGFGMFISNTSLFLHQMYIKNLTETSILIGLLPIIGMANFWFKFSTVY